MYLDFAKAYDKVGHEILLQKTPKIGIRGKVGRCIRAFLTHREQVTYVEGAASAGNKVRSGIPQGSALGPILFLIMINDINTYRESPLLSFVDDTRIFKPISNMQNGMKLQKDLQKVYKWAESNNMTFSDEKFKVISLETIKD